MHLGMAKTFECGGQVHFFSALLSHFILFLGEQDKCSSAFRYGQICVGDQAHQTSAIFVKCGLSCMDWLNLCCVVYY